MYKGPKRKFDKNQRGRHKSEYALQFIEKQKLKSLYNLRENDLKNYYLRAKKNKKATEEFLATLLESRLDNVVYRLGWAKTRVQARQIVNHGHILVDGKKISIPSFQVQPKNKIEIRAKSQKSPLFNNLKDILIKHTPPLWLKRSENLFQAEVLAKPSMADFNEPIDMKRVVEFYSR
jgi:small subunit ribosomal protein S4